jgi:hypothetical protein
MWLATRAQLKRFMSLPIWTKQGSLAFDMAPFLEGSPGEQNWGYPERSASTAVLGGLTDLTPGGGSYTSCMLPYTPRIGDQPADLAEVARIDHLRNAHAYFGSIPVETRVVS